MNIAIEDGINIAHNAEDQQDKELMDKIPLNKF